jgi:hypothetical protein
MGPMLEIKLACRLLYSGMARGATCRAIWLVWSFLTRALCPEPQVPLAAADSCSISPTDLVGGWFNQAKINAVGRGTWDPNVGQNSGRPPFSVTSIDTCGAFDFTFPDDRVYRGQLSTDKSLITFSHDNKWPRTSSETPPICTVKWPTKPKILNARTSECVNLVETYCTVACVTFGLMTDTKNQERWKGGVTSWGENSCGCHLAAALGQEKIVNGKCTNPCPRYTAST